MSHRVRCEGNRWVSASSTSRPPHNRFFKCWAHHKSGKVVLACGDDWGWEKGQFTHWFPESLRHTAFYDWVWLDDDKPVAPTLEVAS